MKLIPLLDKVVAKEIKLTEKKTESGILLPTSAQEKPITAEIIAVGPGGFIDGEDVKMQVKAGDKILFNRYVGSDFKIENENFIILKQADILAVIED